ncbi:hypothetical protein HYW21_05475 [Candidatus Woesearchaeota archaeon]|nr:hypothetical protein [Candidatus Woesearchaeota archaeon]
MKAGEVAFIVGIAVAILAGIFLNPAQSGTTVLGWMALALVVLGLIVGFLNVTENETQGFLIAGIALMATGISGGVLQLIPYIGSALNAIVLNLAVFVAPAVIVVSVKAIYGLAKD